MAQTDEPQAVPKPELTGIDGWLIWPLIGLIFTPLYFVWLVCQRLPAIAERTPAHAQAAQIGFVLLMLPFFAYLIFCLVRFLQRRREVPWLMTVLYGVAIVFGLVSIIARLKGYSGPDGSDDPFVLFGGGVRTLIDTALATVWLFYFHNSVRVANTFTVVGKSRDAKPEPKGLGGWLILPLVAMAITVVVCAIAMIASHFPAKIAFAYTHGQGLVLARQTAGILLVLGYPALSLYLACRRMRLARWLMVVYFGLWAALFIAIFIKEPVKNPAGVLAILLCLASIAYLLLSRRVKNTFVR